MRPSLYTLGGQIRESPLHLSKFKFLGHSDKLLIEIHPYILHCIIFLQFLQKFYDSENRYLNDLTTLVELYYHQLKIAVNSGHVLLRRDQLDGIFLNWFVVKF